MHRRWMRRTLALGMAAMAILCGCDTRMHTVAPTIWEEFAEEEQVTAAPVKFPVTPSGSTLVAEELVSFQGPYWEDGSGDLVEHVAGLMISNPTNRMVEFAAFVVEQAGERLYFFAYCLPPMSRCLVLEYNKKTCDPGLVTACQELCVRWDQQKLSREQVDYVSLGPLMTVINRDARQLSHVTVRYKQYVKEKDYYLGGAVHSAHVFFLQPEERRSVMPEHYDAGRARIVEIEIKN